MSIDAHLKLACKEGKNEVNFLLRLSFVLESNEFNVARNTRWALDALIKDLGTQAAAARAIGISEASLSKWLSARAQPRAKGLQGLGDALGLQMEDFAQAAEDFDALLAKRPALSADREVSLRLPPVGRYRSAWPAAWHGVQGRFKFLYAHRDGTIEVSDIDFVHLGPDGIHTVMKNSNVEEGRIWRYRGPSFAIDGFLYAILSEETTATELFFLIFAIPVGRDTGMIFGHFLARSVKESMRASKAQSCVLVPATGVPDLEKLHGTHTAEALQRLGLLNRSVARHLSDMPTQALKERLSRLFD